MNEINQAKFNHKLNKTDGEVFKFIGKSKKLKKIDILNELCNDISIKDHLNERDVLKSIILDILNENGSIFNENDLESIRSEIMKLLVINPNKHYADAKVNEEGYIEGCTPIVATIIEVEEEMPENIDNGCYEVINNEAVLDEEKVKNTILL